MTQQRYVIASASGNIIRTVVCDESQAGGQAQGTETMIQHAAASNKTHHVSGGVVVAYTASQAAARSEAPGYACEWSNSSMAWVDFRTLPTAKIEKWDVVKAERNRRLDGTFTVGGKTYNCNREAITLAASGAMLAKAALDLTWSKAWTLADNTSTTLTADQVLIVARACDDYISSLWDTGRTLRAQISAATTAAQLAAIAWPQG